MASNIKHYLGNIYSNNQLILFKLFIHLELCVQNLHTLQMKRINSGVQLKINSLKIFITFEFYPN